MATRTLCIRNSLHVGWQHWPSASGTHSTLDGNTDPLHQELIARWMATRTLCIRNSNERGPFDTYGFKWFVMSNLTFVDDVIIRGRRGVCHLMTRGQQWQNIDDLIDGRPHSSYISTTVLHTFDTFLLLSNWMQSPCLHIIDHSDSTSCSRLLLATSSLCSWKG